ncbi:MAG: hypothetical protein R3192_13790 [Woeseiaceae bacterium]|nr:hypothetical protein [Woeseiaceae bacterium]
MDEFEKRLKDDAGNIDVGPSQELRQRIDATLRSTKRIEPVPESRSAGVRLWWASSLTGLAAAVLLVVLINWSIPEQDASRVEPVTARTVPPLMHELQGMSPPRLIRTAEFTTPLEEELARLQADIEKARAMVRKDVEFTF